MLKVRLLVLWCCSLFFLGQNPSVSRAAPGPAGQPAARIKQLRTLAAEQSHTDPALARTTLEQALARARQSHDAQAERGILNDLADVCGRLTELADAQRCINAARRLATQAQDTLELGRAYLFSAMVAEGDTIRQLRFAELAVQQLVLVPRAGNWLLRAQTELATDYLKARKLAAAKQVFRQAQRVSRQLGEAGLADTTRLNLTIKLVRALDAESAPVATRRQLLLANLKLARRIKWVPGELATLNDLGGLASQSSDDHTAQPYYTEAVQRARQTGEHRFLAESLQSLAGLAFNRQDPALAARLYQQAIGAAEPLPPYYQGRTLLIALSGLSSAYLELHQLDSARRPYQRLLRLSHQRHDRLTEYVAQARWGSSLQRYPDKLDSAAVVLQQAIKLADGLGAYYQAFATMGLMQVREQQQRWPDVQRVAAQALHFARLSHTPDYEADALKGLAQALRHQGRSAAGFDTLQKSHALLDTLWSHSKREELLQQQVKFDVGEKEFHIRELEQQRHLAELLAAQQRLRIWGLVGGLLVFGGLTILLLRQRRRLQASETQLRQANKTKDQLIRIVGHDLRSPMASLQQLTPLLHEVIEQPERSTAHALIRTLDAGAQHLGNMVDNLFQWARAQGGQLINNPERLRVSFALQSIAALYAPTAQLKSIAFTTTVPPELLVWADLGLLTTVLRNLAGNALKFTPKGGTVQLTAVAVGEQVEFSILDSGPGIVPGHLQEMLTADRMPSTPGTGGEPGTGLGLPLSARFVRLMGGELHIAPGPAGGTHCWFRLPGNP